MAGLFSGLGAAPAVGRMSNPFRLGAANGYGTPGYKSTYGDVFKTTQPTTYGLQSIQAPAASVSPGAGQDVLSRVVANGQNVFTPGGPTPGASLPAGTTQGQVIPGLGSDTSGKIPVIPGASTGAVASTAGSALDYSGDPILQKIKALGQKNVGDAVQAANAGIKDSLIGFGDPNLARAAHFFTPDAGTTTTGDESTAQAAAQNPLSTLAQLAAKHLQSNAAIDNATNKANLYYGSEHANELAQEGQNYLGSQAQAQSAEQQMLGQIAAALKGVRDSADQQQLSGEQDAYTRALQLALANGTGSAAATTPTPTAPLPSATTPVPPGGQPLAPPVIPGPSNAPISAFGNIGALFHLLQGGNPLALAGGGGGGRPFLVS